VKSYSYRRASHPFIDQLFQTLREGIQAPSEALMETEVSAAGRVD
jgi:hypothetical protein